MRYIYMRNVAELPLHRALTEPLKCNTWDGETEIPKHFCWDGSSVPWILQGLFPRHRHPIASCSHDFLCKRAKNKQQRLWADKEFKRLVATTSWWITAEIGYLGVRIGALFNVGSNFSAYDEEEDFITR